jgi:hypothetical protein
MTIVTLVSGCGNAYPGDGTRDGAGQGGRWVSSTPTRLELLEVGLKAPASLLTAATMRLRAISSRMATGCARSVLTSTGQVEDGRDEQ